MIYAVKIVNKRPRNLLNEIQNVFINGKQVKTAKLTQIILRHKNYRQLTASLQATWVNSDLCTVTTPNNRGFRLRPTRWRPESGSSWYIGTCESFFFSFESNLESNRPYTTQAVTQPNGLQTIGILYLWRTRVMYGLRNSELSTCLFQFRVGRVWP